MYFLEEVVHSVGCFESPDECAVEVSGGVVDGVDVGVSCDFFLEFEEFAFGDPDVDDDVDAIPKFFIVYSCCVSGDDFFAFEFFDAVHYGDEAEVESRC